MLSALYVVILCNQLVMAQITTGTISGTVSDQSGAAVPGATVTIKNVETGVSRSTVTGHTGRYEAPTLPAGIYEVTATMTGFQTSVNTGIELTIGRNAVVNPTLQVGEVTQAVTVTGEVALVETTTATVSNLVSEREVNDLPLNNRDLNQLALLQPGVLRSRESGSNSDGLGTKLVVSGARGNQNLYLLDGVSSADYIGSASNATGAYAGAETVKEFQIITNNYSAEYQSAAGAIVSAVTKSGTNSFHGSLFEFHRNAKLDAFRWEDKGRVGTQTPVKPDFKRNQFGGSLGGPIIRDKTFFFSSYEGLREETSRTAFANIPSPAARQGIVPIIAGGVGAVTAANCTAFGGAVSGSNCALPLSTKVSPYLALWPTAGEAGTAFVRDRGDGTVEVSGVTQDPVRDDFMAVKIDHNFGSDRAGFLSGTYNFDDGYDASFPVLRVTNGGTRDVTRKNILSTQHSSVWSPTVLNQIKVGFARNRITGQQPVERPEFPNLAFIPGRRLLGTLSVSGLTGLGSSEDSQGVTQTTLHIAEALSISRGSHSMRIGGEVTRYWNFMRHHNRGHYGEFAFQDLPRFLIAAPMNFQAAFPGKDDPDRNVGQYFWGTYFQDNWTVVPTLTLNLGLRYEYTTDPVERDGKVAALVHFTDPRQTRGVLVTNPTAKSFSPRFGFAWTPVSRTSLRGGFGVFYDSSILMKNLRSGLTVLEGVAEFGLVTDTATVPRLLDFPNSYTTQPQLLVANSAYTGFQYDTENTTSYRWSLTLQREIGTDLLLSAGYTGARGLHLWVQMNANLNRWEGFPNNPQGPKFFPALPSGQFNRINPAYSEMRFQSPQGNSYYHGLELSARNRLSRGLHFQGAYTFSKNMDQGATLTGGGFGQQQRQIYFWDMSRRKGLSANDIRHSFTGSFTYDVPFGAGLTGIAGGIAKGWQLNGIVTLTGGNPQGVWDNNNAQLARFGERIDGLTVDLIPGGDSNPTSGTTAGCTHGSAVRSVEIPAGAKLGGPDLYFDPCQFVLSQIGYFGTLGSSTLTGPGIAMVDFSLAKDFAITESSLVQFRSEFFNFLNTPQFNNPLATPFDNQGRNNTNITQQIGSTRSNLTARQIQFGLKFVF
jgi:hypothetical protein